MRYISFALTTDQVRNQTKTVTRRLGWNMLQIGQLLQPVEKAQGLKRGEKIRKIGPPIRVIAVTRVPLRDGLTAPDVAAEGFPGMSRGEFVEMFCKANDCHANQVINRIEFEYTTRRADV